MKDILRIMEFLFQSPEQYTEQSVKDKFGESEYRRFSQFCMGGEVPLADDMVGKQLRLTQEGVREFHRLKSEHLQQRFNLLMLIATTVLAVASIVNIAILL